MNNRVSNSQTGQKEGAKESAIDRDRPRETERERVDFTEILYGKQPRAATALRGISIDDCNQRADIDTLCCARCVN